MVWGGLNWSTQIRGTTPDYVHVRAWNVQRGVFFGQRDVDTANKVCVLGQVVVDQLFGGEDPIGQSVRVRSLNCEVIGVLARKGQGGMGQDYDDVVLMPISAVRRKLNNAGAGRPAGVERIYLSAVSAPETQRAQAQVQDLLRQRKRTKEGDPDDPMVRDMTEFAEAAQEANKTMTLLLAGIAAVSLLVGGIGIMNIMLVSVTERTREIGIRMAVGAKGMHILMQFLLEAVVLTMIGGLVGVGIGTGAAKIMSRADGVADRSWAWRATSSRSRSRPWSGCCSAFIPPGGPHGSTPSKLCATNNGMFTGCSTWPCWPWSPSLCCCPARTCRCKRR